MKQLPSVTPLASGVTHKVFCIHKKKSGNPATLVRIPSNPLMEWIVPEGEACLEEIHHPLTGLI